MKSNTKPSQTQKWIIVTTAHKGVFFGFGVPTTDKIIRITEAQMCIYWSASVKGVLGLASNGPNADCRIGPPVPAITLQDVTSIIEVSPQAEAKWKQMPWS